MQCRFLLLRELASNATGAIKHPNANQVRPTTPDYDRFNREMDAHLLH